MTEQMHLDTGVVAPLPPKPQITDDAVVKDAISRLAEKVKEWLPPGGCTDFRDLEQQLLASRDDDGYQFARTLDHAYLWDCDARLVEILDGYEYHLYDAWGSAVKQWAERNRITAEVEA